MECLGEPSRTQGCGISQTVEHTCQLLCNLLSNCFIRCIFSTKPTNDVILPASFPPTEPQPEIPASPLDLGAEDMEHVECLHLLVE